MIVNSLLVLNFHIKSDKNKVVSFLFMQYVSLSSKGV